MPVAQFRTARLTGQVARHVKAARPFSTGSVLRKEIQDAYILSASRTPTAKVRYCKVLKYRDFTSITDVEFVLVQWRLPLRLGAQARRHRHQVGVGKVQGPR
jgi:hypothetical protein